ncbi:hypothetical protein DPX39_100096900 [Trypanosoma brucei equiperdum]|uniref:Uncharacterized protein n=1 Tax=Trypanosoma brucei equiperdum TaxID=630700 RepID=A0A3L6L0X0_9TRYP|nr:hypothetical protein DPX39_100096900 [Trypanosoma brucei equiperdum]
MLRFTRFVTAAVKSGVGKKAAKTPLPVGNAASARRGARVDAIPFNDNVSVPKVNAKKMVPPPSVSNIGKEKAVSSMKARGGAKVNAKPLASLGKVTSEKPSGKVKKTPSPTRKPTEPITVVETSSGRKGGNKAASLAPKLKKTVKQIHRKVMQKNAGRKPKKVMGKASA